MVLVGISDLDQETAEKYPGVYQYGQCQSRAFMKGIFGFFAGGAMGLTANYALRRRYPSMPSVYNVVFVAGGAIATSYVVASIASKKCQQMWVRAGQQPTNAGETAATTAAAAATTTTAALPDRIPAGERAPPTGRGPVAGERSPTIGQTKYGDRME